MLRRKTLRQLHIYSGLVSALIGVYLWLEPKLLKSRRKAGDSK